jgi:hypothetical protein
VWWVWLLWLLWLLWLRVCLLYSGPCCLLARLPAVRSVAAHAIDSDNTPGGRCARRAVAACILTLPAVVELLRRPRPRVVVACSQGLSARCPADMRPPLLARRSHLACTCAPGAASLPLSASLSLRRRQRPGNRRPAARYLQPNAICLVTAIHTPIVGMPPLTTDVIKFGAFVVTNQVRLPAHAP